MILLFFGRFLLLTSSASSLSRHSLERARAREREGERGREGARQGGRDDRSHRFGGWDRCTSAAAAAICFLLFFAFPSLNKSCSNNFSSFLLLCLLFLQKWQLSRRLLCRCWHCSSVFRTYRQAEAAGRRRASTQRTVKTETVRC